MVKWNGLNVASIALFAAVVFGAASSGCSGSMHNGGEEYQGTSVVSSGIETGREGIGVARSGLAEFDKGDHAGGLRRIRQGMALMSQGMDQMHSGFGMMSGGMMGRCSCDPGNMMMPLHQAMADMQQGHDMMADADQTNDEMGAGQMGRGMSAMSAGYDAVGQSMACMGDGDGDGMHGGGMM